MSDNEKVQSVEMEDDSSDSDSSSNEDEYVLENRSRELESKLSTDPYSYDSYVELIEIYKKLMDLSSLRHTFERFHKNYPLTGQLWLDWIKAEIRVASSETEKKFVIDLFDKAVEDYLSIDLWLEYVQFGTGFDDVEFSRGIFERAINACGLHFMKGSLIWDTFREYELALLSIICDNTSDAWKQQVLRVNEIFRRQLSVPLMEMERTFIEWRVWVERLPDKSIIDPEPVNWAYKRATKYSSDYIKFEDKLSDANEDKWKIYQDYIYFENKPETIRCLYERAVADLSLNPEIWMEYCIYYFKLSNYDAALKTCQRAIRNCTWDANLWILTIRIMEIAGKSHQEVTDCFEQALNSIESGQYTNLWLCYLEHFRRVSDPEKPEDVEKLRKAFEKGLKHLNDYGSEADPECSFLRFWAKIEASFLKDITAARNIWNDYGILKYLGNYANTWLDLISLEQQYGDEKHIRKTFQRALSSTKDWPQCIIQSWTNYERQFGNVESIITSTETCRNFMIKWNLEHPTQEETNNEELEKSRGKKRKFKEFNKNSENKRRREEKLDESTNEQDLSTKEQIILTSERDETSESDKIIESKAKDFSKIEMDFEKQHRSVFISNLDYTVTEDELQKFLGAPEELRLIKDRKGVSKGYAYCVFATQEEASNTLKRDRELLHDRPVFISECKVDKMQRESIFKYSTSQEKHKLFVKGLPLTMKNEDLETLFKPHGEIKEIRLVTYRNGRSKGLAYVEFKNETDATKAIIAIDNKEIDGHIISVAISNPPKRKTEKPVAELLPNRHSKSRLQIPLLPRSLQTKAINSEKQSQPTMTNEDFRKMLNIK